MKVDPLTCARSAAWSMLYADDAGIVSQSAEGVAKMMTVIVSVFEAVNLTVSEKKTATMLLRTPNQAPQTSPLVIDAARQTMQLLYLHGLVVASSGILSEITRRVRLEWACYNRFKGGLYDMEDAPFTLKSAHPKGRVASSLVRRSERAPPPTPALGRRNHTLSAGTGNVDLDSGNNTPGVKKCRQRMVERVVSALLSTSSSTEAK